MLMLAIKYSVHIIKTMKLHLAGVLLIITLLFPVGVHAQSNDVLITAVQTESAVSATEEYMVVTNNTAFAVDVSDWHLQYFSATAANFNTPTRNIALSGSLPAHGQFMAASSGYKATAAQVFFGSTLASAGGHVRLTSGSGTSEVQHDLLGWGTAQHPESMAVAALAKGLVYTRKQVNGSFIDTDNNAADFDDGAGAVAPVAPTPSGSDTTAPAAGATAQVDITELLPDPAAPATDANDEFVELYNPGSATVSLTGYKLQTGSKYSYSHVFTEGSLAPGEYKAFYSKDTNLTLSNTAGKARLLDADGTTMSETADYGAAPTGSSWSFYDWAWAWTSAPTPDAANGPPAAVAAKTTTPAISAVTKAANTAKATTTNAKVAGATTTKAAAAKAPKAAAATTNKPYSSPTADNKSLPVNPLLLAAVGVPLLGYMVYEYRHDIANRFAKLRRHRSLRRQTRTALARRGSH